MSNKHIFWQAFVVTFIIFWIGILMGIYFEKSRIAKLDKFYFDSETEMIDLQLSSQILKSTQLNCNISNEKSISFADRIYNEAKQLEKYDESNKLTQDIISVHKRYDLLRTMLWESIIENQQRCKNNANTIVYLYKYLDATIETKALQGAMSNSLVDLKNKYGSKLILIPLAADTNVDSLSILMKNYNISHYPVIIINDKYFISDLKTVAELEKYLK